MDVIRKRKRSRKSVVIEESSSSNEENTSSKDKGLTPDSLPLLQNAIRSSERLQKKRCREFHMPTKEDVLKKITPAKSPGKYEQLRPKRLVNDFTRESNRYNYDPNETSGDESMEDFLNDSISEMSSSSVEIEKTSKPKRQIKGRRQRLYFRSGSDDSDSTDVEVCAEDTSLDKNEDILSGDSAICVKTFKSETKKGYKKQLQTEDSEVELNGETKNGKGIEDDTDEQTDVDDDSDEEVVVRREHNRSIIESDEDSSSENNSVNVKQENGGIDVENITEEVKPESHIKLESTSASDAAGNDGSSGVDRTCESPQKIKLEPTSSSPENLMKACNSREGIDVGNNLADKSSDTTDSESGSNYTSNSDDESDTNEKEGCSSRIRVRMLKKKQKRSKLFEKFRKERDRRLSKEHK